MRIPIMQGVIDRRILANYRVDPAVLQNMLPAPFRPKLVNGKGIAGICLIRLKELRPRHLPAIVGLSSENAAHRIAVEWDENGTYREGVYILRRDSSSRLNTMTGGRLFPGVHHHARFDVREEADFISIAVASDDGEVNLSIQARIVNDLPGGSVFPSVAAASQFFERGSVGYSPGRNQSLEGMELRSQDWKVEPLAVEQISSSVFDNSAVVPRGSAEFDCALLMRNIRHEWHETPLPQMANSLQ